MDRITDIELQLKNVLLNIDEETPLPNYTFYNTVTVVNIDDEALALDRGDYPTIAIYLDPNETVLSGEQRAFRNKLSFKIVGSVSNDEPIDMPRFEINQKMNELYSDIKAVLSDNYQLNNSCDRVDIKSSTRKYLNDGLRAGDIEIIIDVYYSQSRLNPNINACI